MPEVQGQGFVLQGDLRSSCKKHPEENPELALEDFYIDEQGRQHRQLLSLCDACHKDVYNEQNGGLPDKSYGSLGYLSPCMFKAKTV